MKILHDIQAGHIHLHVGDNVAPSGRGVAPPKKTTPVFLFVARIRLLLYVDLAFLFDWRLHPSEMKKVMFD